MALPVHNTTTSGSKSFGSSVTFAHTTTGADKYLNVFVAIRSSSVTISSVTHNGNSLVLVTGSLEVATGITVAHYQMVAPDATGNVVITLSGSSNVIGVANSYTGVDQTTPFGDVQTATTLSGTTSSITITSANDELCIDGFSNRNTDTPTITGGQTLRGTVDSASQINSSCSELTGITSTVMSWSMATSGIRKNHSGYSIKGVSGGGGVTVTATLGTIDYTSQDATVALTGSIDVATTLGTISYSSQSTTVSLTGAVDVTVALGSINYSSQNTTVSVTGDIDVITTLGAIDYSSNNTTVNLTSEVVVNTTLGAIDYTSQNTIITLSGLVGVTATLGAIVYNSYPVTIQIGEGQTIGNVTVGFADDIYTAGFKPDTITVSFK